MNETVIVDAGDIQSLEAFGSPTISGGATMNEVAAGQVLVGDCLEAAFPRHYSAKEFMHDASRLRDLARKRTRQALTEDEQREVTELRKRLRRADADTVLLTVIKTRHAGGLLFF